MVERLTCPSCDVAVLDMHDPAVAAKAKSYGVRTVPAVVVHGRLVGWCTRGGPDEAGLKAAGVGLPLP
jgi:glutaredoxin 3